MYGLVTVKFRLLCALGFVLCTGATAHATTCSREELAKAADAYMNALSSRKPSAAPLAADVKFTENAKPLKIGEGMWQTAGAVSFQRKALDRETCGALVQAVLAEEGQEKDTILGVRLKLNDAKKISEVETYIARATEFAQKPEGVPLEDGDDWEAIVPEDQRTTREVMNAGADLYFDMFDRPKEVVVPFATPCNRYENGTRTTRGDCSNMGPAGRGGMKMTNRRYLITDLEAGITVGFVLFVGRLYDFHMFKYRNGKITQIQAVVGPAVESTGWE